MNSNFERCFYCERRFGLVPFNSDKPLERTKDHIQPLSRGGKSDPSNIVYACKHCNMSKGGKTLSQWETMLINLKLFGGGRHLPGLYFHRSCVYRIDIILENIKKLIPPFELTEKYLKK